jgi:hypothetical protein
MPRTPRIDLDDLFYYNLSTTRTRETISTSTTDTIIWDSVPNTATKPKEIPLTLCDDDPYPPTVARIIKKFGGRGREFEEGFKVEIVMVIDDPTKEDRRSIIIRVIDDDAPDSVKGAIACVSSPRLRLEG